jgi:hypothetical protein
MQQWGQTLEDGKGEAIVVIRVLALFIIIASALTKWIKWIMIEIRFCDWEAAGRILSRYRIFQEG